MSTHDDTSAPAEVQRDASESTDHRTQLRALVDARIATTQTVQEQLRLTELTKTLTSIRTKLIEATKLGVSIDDLATDVATIAPFNLLPRKKIIAAIKAKISERK
ncbi:MAG: hypothetical protein ACYDA1_06185 [Vulcanimicrobiaceae bacterium]